MMDVSGLVTDDFLSVESEQRLSSVFGKMHNGDVRDVVVVDDRGRYQGMLDRRALLRSKIDLNSKVRGFSTKGATLASDDSVERAAELLHSADVYALPVLDDNDKIIGLVLARKVIDVLRGRLEGRQAREFSSKKVFTVGEDDPISSTVRLFREKKIDHLPVVDDNGRLVGLVSSVDLMVRYHLATAEGTGSHSRGGRGASQQGKNDPNENQKPTDLPVANVMSRQLITADAGSSVDQVIDVLLDQDVSSVVLLSGSEVEAIITSKDLLRYLAAS